MITINQNYQFQIENILFVFALEMEAAEVFNEQNTLFVGVGKVNATYELTKAIHQKKTGFNFKFGYARTY